MPYVFSRANSGKDSPWTRKSTTPLKMPMLEMPIARSDLAGDLLRKWDAMPGAQWPPLQAPC